ncbi:hypothetical protein ASF92_20200 [Pedobacter sp. Leaf176]|nr:hypothetical protein ASF92_20200 [Pedobacter sp. Leaf176]
MLGNDIVDLNLAKIQSNWRRKNYLDKIFTEEEHRLISSAKDPDVLVWILWSMKESAYKICNRITNKRLFNPAAFQCSIVELNNETAKGLVNYNTLKVLTTTEIKTEFIHTIATDDIRFSKNIRLWRNQYPLNYPQLFNKQNTDYQLYKNENNLPEVKNLCNKTPHHVSVSHHGNYLCIVFDSDPIR